MDIIQISQVRVGDTIEVEDKPATVTSIIHAAFTFISVKMGLIGYGFDQDSNAEVILLERAV